MREDRRIARHDDVWKRVRKGAQIMSHLQYCLDQLRQLHDRHGWMTYDLQDEVIQSDIDGRHPVTAEVGEDVSHEGIPVRAQEAELLESELMSSVGKR